MSGLQNNRSRSRRLLDASWNGTRGKEKKQYRGPSLGKASLGKASLGQASLGKPSLGKPSLLERIKG